MLVEEIADSPAVTAAISQQGFGFADQVGGDVRNRSRRTDNWLEHAARRLSRGHATGPSPPSEGNVLPPLPLSDGDAPGGDS